MNIYTRRLLLSIMLPFAVLFSFCACMDNTDGLSPVTDGDELPTQLDGDSNDNADGDANGEEINDRLHQVKPWAIAVVGTDYYSSSISVLDRSTRKLFRESVIDSGSASAGLSIALSGDVVFPRSHNFKNWIVLLDRYPNSVLTFIDPNDFTVISQLSVATGFASNPHDFLWLDEHKAYVTRYERNPDPGSEPYDEGDDILIVDPLESSITGRIALDDCADTDSDPDMQARPHSMAWGKGLVWVSLDQLTGDFQAAGEAILVAVDPQSDEVVRSVHLPKLRNCMGIVYSPKHESLFISCSGLFIDGHEGQISHSGILQVDLSGEEPQACILAEAAEGNGRPYGFDVDLAQDRWLLATRFGDLDTSTTDLLVALDIETGDESTVHESSSAFGLGGVLADDATGWLYVGDADPVSPGVHLYRIDQGDFEYDGKIETHPSIGLPPRHIRFY